MNEARKSGKCAGRQNGSDQRVIFAVEWPKNRERSLRAGLLQQQRTRRDLVNAHPHANFLLNRLERLIDTVHKFQGDERDVMIFSPVVSEGITDGAVNFLKKTDNLFNVAITRASRSFAVWRAFVAETTRVGRERVVQRRLLNLGELNTTQIDRWQRSIEVIEEDGRACQRRLFSDREGRAPQQQEEDDVCEVVLSSLAVRRPRTLGDCWLGCRLWEELGLDTFWSEALGDRRGAVEWSKVMELLAVIRLCAPGSELSIHERWFSRTAMDFLLGCDEAVAGKDRLYRALDKALEHRDALMGHLQERWSDLFGAECQILLYDLTSTYFEGEAEGVESAARGYSRDHRPDTLQVVVALVVTPEGFPVAYEVFDGDTADVTTLEEIVDKIENKYGMRGRVWVFDRGIVSEDNLQDLRQRGAFYLVGTPRRKLADFERELLEGDWQEIAGKPGVRVQLLKELLAQSVHREALPR